MPRVLPLLPPVWESTVWREHRERERCCMQQLGKQTWEIHFHGLHPSSWIRKLLASTSQHKTTQRWEPPEKGSPKTAAGKALLLCRVDFLIRCWKVSREVKPPPLEVFCTWPLGYGLGVSMVVLGIG